MSQSGSLSNQVPIIPGNVPIDFVTDVGGPATSVGNVIVVTGASTPAGSVPLFTAGAGNTVTYNIQKSQAIAATDATKVGVASFDSASFAVDANGFVTIIGSTSPLSRMLVQTGTSPVIASGGAITFNGSVVSAGTNPVRTDGTGANTMALEVQRSQAIVATDATKVGLAVFDSASFSVDANGYVTLATAGPATTITGNTGGALPTTANNWNILGTGSITNAGSGSTLTVQLTGLTNHAILVGAGTATITKVGPTATAGQVLQSAGAAADPAFSTATYPSTTTVSQILYSSSTNVVAGLATTNRAVLTTGATGIPVLTALATDGQVIIGSTAGVPAAALLTAGTGITITNGSNAITIAANGSVLGQTITGDSGGALSPTAGNWNLLGSGSITTSGSGSTLTTQLTSLTNHNVLIGAGTSTITKVAPSATSGVPLISQGAASDPAFGTAVVAGGGTGATSFTAYAVITGGTTSTGALQNVSGVGTSGQILTSNGAGALPTWQSGSASTTAAIKITKFTASATWTKATSPSPIQIQIIAWGGGAGGGSGCKNAAGTFRQGASGGGGGQFINYTFAASVFGATETVTIGATAAGGTAQSSDNTNGNSGTVGTNTSIGSVVIAVGGKPGNPGLHQNSNVDGAFAQPSITNYLFNNDTSGIGASPIGATSSPASALAFSGYATMGATGGGSGGGVNASDVVGAGTDAGTNYKTDGTTIKTAGGLGGAISTNGGVGGNAVVDVFNYGATGGGGGGGSKTTNGGTGGNGGTPGSGGGGGGSSLNAVGNSGAGGIGARGELWVIEYF